MLSSPFNRLQEQYNKKLIQQELVKQINNIKKRNMLIRESNFMKMQQYKKFLEENKKNAISLEEDKKQKALEDKKQKSLEALIKKQNELEERKKQATLETKPKNKKTFHLINDTNKENKNLEKEKPPVLEQSKNKKTFTFI